MNCQLYILLTEKYFVVITISYHYFIKGKDISRQKDRKNWETEGERKEGKERKKKGKEIIPDFKKSFELHKFSFMKCALTTDPLLSNLCYVLLFHFSMDLLKSWYWFTDQES